jgi:glycosyltransferase involved in cell wall biosynthesis
MKNNPLVSICIPVYNAEAYIEDAIKSCISQTYRNIEIIVVDNSSTDKSYEIAQNFLDARIRLYKNPKNLGMCGNWNLCLQYANGEYIKILPADDILDENCVEEQAYVLNFYENISLVCCNRNVFLDGVKFLFQRKFKFFSEGIYSKNKILQMIARSGTNVIGEPGAVLFKKTVANDVGEFDKFAGYVIDLEYWLRLIQYKDLYHLDKSMVSFRVNSGSQSVAMIKTQAGDVLSLIDSFLHQVNYPKWFVYLKVYRNVALRFLFYKFYL